MYEITMAIYNRYLNKFHRCHNLEKSGRQGHFNWHIFDATLFGSSDRYRCIGIFDVELSRYF